MEKNKESLDLVVQLTGEKLLFSLLGKILFVEIDKPWLQTLIDEDVFAESPFGESQSEVKKGLELLQKWSQENGSGISDQSILDLRADYTRLFVGVGIVLAPVWESVYFNDGRLTFQEETLQVRSWFRRYKLESEKLYQEPDDHLGLELTFIAHLAQLGLQALEQNDTQAVQETLDAQRDFLNEHLLRWAFIWANLVNKSSKTDFYRGIGHLVCGALTEAANLVGARLPEEK